MDFMVVFHVWSIVVAKTSVAEPSCDPVGWAQLPARALNEALLDMEPEQHPQNHPKLMVLPVGPRHGERNGGDHGALAVAMPCHAIFRGSWLHLRRLGA